MRQIWHASQVRFIPPQHKGKGKVTHNAIRNSDSCLAPLKEHFDYVTNLGKVRATRVAATLVDGVVGRANWDDTIDMVYLPISMGYRNCYKCYMMDVCSYHVRRLQRELLLSKRSGVRVRPLFHFGLTLIFVRYIDLKQNLRYQLPFIL